MYTAHKYLIMGTKVFKLFPIIPKLKKIERWSVLSSFNKLNITKLHFHHKTKIMDHNCDFVNLYCTFNVQFRTSIYRNNIINYHC